MSINGFYATALLLFSVPVGAASIYTQDFEGAVGTEWSGSGSAESTGGLSGYGFGSQHWRNATTGSTTLTLSGLAAHSQVTLTFNLALWDSTDLGGDQFIVQADSNTLYDESRDFGNYYPSDNLGRGPGTLITPAFTAFGDPNFGYNSFYRDSARTVSFTFAHTASTLAITWQYPNSQGGFDESFGIDNVVISSDARPSTGVVPEPSTLALGAVGLGLLASRLRR